MQSKSVVLLALTIIVAMAALASTACDGAGNAASRTATTLQRATATAAPPINSSTPSATSGDIHKIKHVVVIMQENRSFDSYFGTYPGADGIPMQHGQPSVCVPDPTTSQCVKPFHDANDLNHGGPHGQSSATNDIAGGKMDGFITEERGGRKVCKDPNDPTCSSAEQAPDVMGYHDAREIPNYWQYAQQFVLQDKMFEPNASWSLPEHLFMVSGWSAKCPIAGEPLSCVSCAPVSGPAARFPGWQQRHRHGQASRLRLDRPYVPAPQGQRLLGVLRRRRHRARLRKRAGDLPAEAIACRYARHLEPAAVLRHRPPGWTARQHPDAR